MKIPRIPLVSVIIGHALAWAAALFNTFVYSVLLVVYAGEKLASTPHVQPLVESKTAPIYTDMDGLRGLVGFFTPVLITAIALVGVLAFRDRRIFRMGALWVPTVALLAFCSGVFFTVRVWDFRDGLGLLDVPPGVGLTYLPAAIALTVAALADHAKRPTEA